MRCRSCNPVCGLIGAIIGAVVGVGIGLLFFYEQIPGLAAALPTVAGFGITALAALIVGAAVASFCPNGGLADCLAENGVRLLIGSLGTALAAWLFGLFTLFTVQLILAAIAAFFATYLLVQIACFATCLVRDRCGNL